MTWLIGWMVATWAIAISLALYGTYCCLRRFSKTAPHLDAPFGLYPVSVLKPLKGVDEGLRDNLESFFNLSYPEFEILFSVADTTDPAILVVRSLMKQYPKVKARLIQGAVDIGPNPKVNNMVRSYDQALYDTLLISDSNMRVRPDYLKRLVAHLEADVGMVTAIVTGHSPKRLGGYLESIYLNTFYARGMSLAFEARRPCVLGKTMLFSKKQAERFGGIRALGRYLAEDYMAGEAMRKLGLRVVLMCEPVVQHIGSCSFHGFWSRHMRWGRIRKAQEPLVFLVEPWLGSLASGILGAFGFYFWFGFSPAVFLALHLTVWAFADLLLIQKQGAGLTVTVPLAWFLREFLAFPLWIAIACGNSVQWRGQKLVIQSGGIFR